MPSEVHEQIQGLGPVLQSAIKVHVEQIQTDSDVYGYALMLGEDIDQCNVIAVTNAESALADHKETEEEADYRYLVDEWQDWHHDAFSSFNAQLDDVYEQFRDSCPEDEDRESYSDEEVEYLKDIYELYFQAMKTVVGQGAFTSIWYRMIWISDSDRPIIQQAFYGLNSGKPIDEACQFFPK